MKTFLPTILACLALILGRGTIHAAPLRLAIVAEGDAASFGDLLTAQIGEATRCPLVERSELNRLASEASLTGLNVAERPLALARLAHADALLFARVDATDAKNPLLVLRLTTSADGAVRHAIVLPWLPAEIATSTRLAVEQFKEPIAQAGAQTKARTISLLGLRAVQSDARLQTLETTLNTLLSHQLARQPDLVVLERWRMDDLVFERAMQPLGLPDLKTGSLLLDGSLTAKGDHLSVRLRTRRSESDSGKEEVIEGNKPAALVDGIVAALARQQSLRAAPPWQPAAEARAYGELGDWLLRHSLSAEAAQAYESAIALGQDDFITKGYRVWAYCQCAFEDNLQGFPGSRPGLPILDESYMAPHDLTDGAYRLTAGKRACDLAFDLLANTVAPPDTKWAHRPTTIGLQAFYTAVRTLRALHHAGLQQQFAAQIESLRESIATLHQQLDASAAANSYSYLNIQVNYAAYWNSTPESTLAFYRRALSPEYGRQVLPEPMMPAASYPAALRAMLTYYSHHGPFLDHDPKDFAERSESATARLIAWNDRDAARIKPMWKAFLEELHASPDLQSQADAFSLEYSSYFESPNRSRLLAARAEWLWSHHQELLHRDTEAIYNSIGVDLGRLGMGAENSAACHQLVDSLVVALDGSDWVPAGPLRWIEALSRDHTDANFGAAEARRLADALDRFQARHKSDARWTNLYGSAFYPARSSLNRMTSVSTPPANATVATPPTKPVAPIDKNALTVTRFWMPGRILYPGDRNFGSIGRLESPDCLTSYEDRIWFSHSRAGIISLDPGSMDAQLTPCQEKSAFGFTVQPTADKLWIASTQKIFTRPRAGGEWHPIDIPDSQHRLRLVNGKMFAFHWAMKGESSLSEFLPDGPHLIFSTRRKPPEHPFDSDDISTIHGLFTGPGGEPWIAMIDGDFQKHYARIYSLQEPLKPKFTFPTTSAPIILTDGPRTFFLEQYFVRGRGSSLSGVWLVDAAKKEPALLLYDPANSSQPQAGKPRWNLPDFLLQPSRGKPPTYSLFMRGEDLWMLHYDGISLLELIGFRQGQANAVRIPLNLIPSQADIDTMGLHYTRADETFFSDPAIVRGAAVATKFGVAFPAPRGEGIWIVPWADVDRWMREHP